MSLAVPLSTLSELPPSQRWSDALRASSLLDLSVPREYGGRGAGWDEVLQTLRDLSERDGTLARLFALHHLQLASVGLLGSTEQRERLLPLSVEREWLWGEAVDHQESRLLAREHRRGGFLLQGGRHDCFGAEAVDWLLISARHAPSEGLLIAALPADRDGLDRFEPNGGGLLRCHEVRLHPEDILLPPGLPWTPRAQLRGSLAGLLQANIAIGLAVQAFENLPARAAGELQRLLALGLRLSEQSAVAFEAAQAAGNGLSFSAVRPWRPWWRKPPQWRNRRYRSACARRALAPGCSLAPPEAPHHGACSRVETSAGAHKLRTKNYLFEVFYIGNLALPDRRTRF